MSDRRHQSVLVVVALLGAATIAFAQAMPEADRSEPGGAGVSSKSISDPPPAGFTVYYLFAGVRDTTPVVPNSAAVCVHCANAGASTIQVIVEVADFDADPSAQSDPLTIPPGCTRTFCTQRTQFYAEDYTFDFSTDQLDQGSGRVMANSSGARLMCTVDVVPPTSNPPSYLSSLTLFDHTGTIWDWNQVFNDDFESGDTAYWSTTVGEQGGDRRR